MEKEMDISAVIGFSGTVFLTQGMSMTDYCCILTTNTSCTR